MKFLLDTPKSTSLTPPLTSRPWNAAQRLRAQERMRQPWQQAVSACSGRFALSLISNVELLATLASADLKLEPQVWALTLCVGPQRAVQSTHTDFMRTHVPAPAALAAANVNLGCIAEVRHWPIQPGCIDAVFCALSEDLLTDLPALLREMDISLMADAKVVFNIDNAALATWCRVGMPLCRRLGWVMRSADWGDARRLTRLPTRLRRRWSETWQQWLPGVAEWSVQSWQKETVCPASRSPQLKRHIEQRWSPEWVPQSRAAARVRVSRTTLKK